MKTLASGSTQIDLDSHRSHGGLLNRYTIIFTVTNLVLTLAIGVVASIFNLK